ncbi:hypothetical protein GCM10010174_61360 [Kutzneria viridogrisea]|uniref:Uncharacterized protein n=1 Tax=Kutzneria viridogrisea TaxID=47990 RepID=A0ABR6BGD4_9PSEU|nr:hypothetical protein [Kutzneria viridogrisea]
MARRTEPTAPSVGRINDGWRVTEEWKVEVKDVGRIGTVHKVKGSRPEAYTGHLVGQTAALHTVLTAEQLAATEGYSTGRPGWVIPEYAAAALVQAWHDKMVKPEVDGGYHLIGHYDVQRRGDRAPLGTVRRVGSRYVAFPHGATVALHEQLTPEQLQAYPSYRTSPPGWIDPDEAARALVDWDTAHVD